MARRRRLSTRFRQVYPRPLGKGFTPYQPVTRPPAGTYDPTLDAAERAANRGLGDLTLDYERDAEREQSDYLLATQGAVRERGEGLADLRRQRKRGLEDYDRQETRGLEDYGRQERQGLEDYGRQRGTIGLGYQRLGGRQAQSLSQAGVGGGAFAQALAKRAENQGRDLEPIGIGETRLKEATALGSKRLRDDTRLGRTRLNESVGTSEKRLKASTERRLGELATRLRRSGEDRTTALSRAQRENLYFGQDTSAARFFQAKGTGYIPPTQPKNEYTRNGLTFRLTGTGNNRIYTLPTGERLTRAEYLRRVRGMRMR